MDFFLLTLFFSVFKGRLSVNGVYKMHKGFLVSISSLFGGIS